VTDEASVAGTVERVESVEHTHIGGQAVIEGVMMRGKYNWAVAVRTPGGGIHCEAHDLATAPHRRPWLAKPIVRGVVALYDTVSLAMKAIGISASYSGESEEEQLSDREVGFVMVFGVLLAIGLFIVLPYIATNLLVGRLQDQPFKWNLVDGVLRLLVLFGYIWLISRMKDVKRLFAYHGAEHKTIHAYEHHVPLEPTEVQQFGTAHVRCGTSFLLMVMVVALVVYLFVPLRLILSSLGVTNAIAMTVLTLVIRISLLPVIAGIAYEVIRYAGRHESSRLVKVLLWPGMQLQRMTTSEPDDSMVEIAVAAVKPIIAREEAEAAGTYTAEMDLGCGHGDGTDAEQSDQVAAMKAQRIADERDDIVGVIDA
jgi:uncharacterized protein YqhQ